MTDERRPVVVRLHAVEQLRKRRPTIHGDTDATSLSRLIRREVQAGIAHGRIHRRKPVGFRLYGQKQAKALPPGQVLVTSESSEFGWVVAREPGQDVVITTLTRAASSAA